MNYNTNVINHVSIDDIKNYAPFLFTSVQEYVELNYDIILGDLYKKYNITSLSEQYGYAREFNGTRFDINIKVLDSVTDFQFNILNNIKDADTQNCILTFINNSIIIIKSIITEIGIHYNIDFPELIIDANLNISFKNTVNKKHEKYINVSINIGNQSARTHIVDI